MGSKQLSLKEKDRRITSFLNLELFLDTVSRILPCKQDLPFILYRGAWALITRTHPEHKKCMLGLGEVVGNQIANFSQG